MNIFISTIIFFTVVSVVSTYVDLNQKGPAAISTSEDGDGIHSHISRQKRDTTKAGVTKQDKEGFINTHNAKRRAVNPPATNMRFMVSIFFKCNYILFFFFNKNY